MTGSPRNKGSLRNKSRSFDQALGAQVKALRAASGMSQSDVGSRLGVSYQQIQKYESGHDRIAVYMLQEIAVVFNAPITAFFDKVTMPVGNKIDIREAMKTAAALQEIEDPTVRRRLISLIEALGPADKDRAKKA